MASYRIAATTSGFLMTQGTRQLLFGYSIIQGSGVNQINFRDGGAAGPIVMTAIGNNVGANNSTLTQPITFNAGIYVEIVQGSPTNIAVYVE